MISLVMLCVLVAGDLRFEVELEATQVARLRDLRLKLILRNVGSESASATFPNNAYIASELIELTIQSASGQPVVVPAHEILVRTPDHRWQVEVAPVDAQRSVERSIGLASWLGWREIDLAAGAYRLVAVLPGESLRAPPATFILTGSRPVLGPGEPSRGLRADLEIDQPRATYAFGESIDLLYHVCNVSDHAIVFFTPEVCKSDGVIYRPAVEPARCSQVDEIVVERTGLPWPERDVQWRLQPGETVLIPGRSFRIVRADTPVEVYGMYVVSDPGAHTLASELRLLANASICSLRTGELTLEVR